MRAQSLGQLKLGHGCFSTAREHETHPKAIVRERKTGIEVDRGLEFTDGGRMIAQRRINTAQHAMSGSIPYVDCDSPQRCLPCFLEVLRDSIPKGEYDRGWVNRCVNVSGGIFPLLG